MEKLVRSNLKLGIIAGGQLAKMLIQEASKWNITTYVLDEDKDCPAGTIASHFVKGSRLDYDSVYQFGQLVDVLTFEIESINIAALKQLKAEGLRIVPDAEILELVQDKGKQKEFYQQNQIPTSPFQCYNTSSEIRKALENGDIHFPFVQKIRVGGYDGRGVAVINDTNDLDKLLEGASLVEEKVDIAKELAVIAARNKDGDISCFPVVEMIFDPVANLVDKLLCPSSITREQAEKTTQIASELVESMGFEGIMAIEFFLDSKGEIVVNEIAPRPHNSGHHTIEGILTSQYEQHLRAILNMPLGSTRIKLPAVMVNLLGEENHEGPVQYEGLADCLKIDGVKIHLYGKKITKPFRKMGHVTILDISLEKALEKADQVKQLIKVRSWKKAK